VLGNAKGVFTTVMSILIFQNPYTVHSAGGYFITVIGVAFYAWAKRYTSSRAQKDDRMAVTRTMSSMGF
jgi:hypothetical protein